LRLAASPDSRQYPGHERTDVIPSDPSSDRRRRRDHARLVRLLGTRPRKDWERHPLMIGAALPAGTVRAAGQRQWLDAVRASPALAGLRADSWATTLDLATHLAWRSDWQLGTARPTWPVLMADTGLSRRSVARILARLRAAGLLGVVATGRSAGTDPMALDDGASAAVYVLAVPSPLRLTPSPSVADPSPGEPGQEQGGPPDTTSTQEAPSNLPAYAPRPVHELGTPSELPLGAQKPKNPNAREAHSSIRDLGRAELIAAGQIWDPTAKPLRKSDRFCAAAELRRRDPVLAQTSTPALASVLREWHLAGWTILDIQKAINTRPDGTMWPHQLTVAPVEHLAGWLRYRLSSWRTDPLDPASPAGHSPSDRARAEQIHARARAAARAAAETAAQAHRAPSTPDMAAMKAELRRRTLTRAHKQHPTT